MKNLKTYILTYAIVFLAGALIGEAILRYKGIQPVGNDRPEIEVSPGNQYFQKDSLLGYRHLAGKFEVTLKKEYTFTTTHDSNGLRITHPLAERKDSLPQTWLMGCSFTHGWSVNDEETFAWQLQKELPSSKIVNFGMNGLGTIHAYLQLQRAFEAAQRRPEKVVILYADFHKERNTFSLARRRAVARWNFLGSLTQPYARIKNGKFNILQADKVEYNTWWLAEQSSLISFIQSKADAFSDAKIDGTAVTQALLLEIKSLCENQNIDLLIANIWKEGAEEIKAFCEKQEMDFVDISVDLSQAKMTNMPYDGHPSAKAHRIFSDKLLSHVTQ